MAGNAAGNEVENTTGNAYARSGVDVEAGYEVVSRIKKHVARTAVSRSGVLGGLGGFGGAFDLSAVMAERGMKEPVLISGTDGVGTKLLLAIQSGRHNTIGIDCVAMCVNDIVAAGADPLYFLDYIACGKNDPAKLEQVVAGVADGCVQAGAALIGGETAEMPGMYGSDEYDLAGFAVGVAEKANLIDGEKNVAEGDILIGLPSSGIHSNGYSLVRKVFADELSKLSDGENAAITAVPELGKPLLDELLTPTKIYVRDLLPLLRAGLVNGIAHITGGGFIENIPRMFGSSLAAEIREGTWPVLPIFDLLERRGGIKHSEMFEIFNMGLGIVMAVSPSKLAAVKAELGETGSKFYEIGRMVSRAQATAGGEGDTTTRAVVIK
jgi:phosphoribosylformylglycinamidine cyclo-ligase